MLLHLLHLLNLLLIQVRADGLKLHHEHLLLLHVVHTRIHRHVGILLLQLLIILQVLHIRGRSIVSGTAIGGRGSGSGSGLGRRRWLLCGRRRLR